MQATRGLGGGGGEGEGGALKKIELEDRLIDSDWRVFRKVPCVCRTPKKKKKEKASSHSKDRESSTSGRARERSADKHKDRDRKKEKEKRKDREKKDKERKDRDRHKNKSTDKHSSKTDKERQPKDRGSGKSSKESSSSSRDPKPRQPSPEASSSKTDPEAKILSPIPEIINSSSSGSSSSSEDEDAKNGVSNQPRKSPHSDSHEVPTSLPHCNDGGNTEDSKSQQTFTDTEQPSSWWLFKAVIVCTCGICFPLRSCPPSPTCFSFLVTFLHWLQCYVLLSGKVKSVLYRLLASMRVWE